MNCELHHGGNSLNNAANLHVRPFRTASFTSSYLCTGAIMCGLFQDIEVGRAGMAHELTEPGYQINWDLVEHGHPATI